MIYTVTLNPALDYIMDVPALAPGETNRARTVRMAAGGKGVNVSLLLSRLGCPTVPLGVCAGATGAYFLRELSRAGLAPDFILTDPEGGADVWTRINVKLSGEGGEELEVNAAGAPLPDGVMDTLTDRLAARLTPGDTLALCGSLPSGAPDETCARLLDGLYARGVDLSGIRLAADTTGRRLSSLLPYRPFVIKPNLAELEALTGTSCRENGTPDDRLTVTAARTLQTAGARNVLVSLGASGALLVPETGPALRIGALTRPAGAPTGNTTGAGDSMLAGFLCACDRGLSMPDALRFASVCGAATAFSLSGVAQAADVGRLEPAGMGLPVREIG